MRNMLLLAASVVLLLVSCNKDDDDQPEYDPLSVYVHGAGTLLQENGVRAIYMKNKQVVTLPPLSGISSAIANDIQLSGEDVYIVGAAVELDGNSYNSVKALLWKNGQVQELHTPASKSAVAQAVFVSGSDVYIAGSYMPDTENATRRAVVWKNGEPIHIGSNEINTRLEDLYVSGNNVYVTGYETLQGKVTSKYWKNGVATPLSPGESVTYAKSICADNNNVYVVGYAEVNGNRSLKLWKNGVVTNLISGKSVIRGGDVTVDNGNVYVTGYEQVGSRYVPRVFKNNKPMVIQYSNSTHAYAYSLQVLDGNVYVLGKQDQNGTAATRFIWENGRPIEFLTSTATQVGLQSMFIVPKK